MHILDRANVLNVIYIVSVKDLIPTKITKKRLSNFLRYILRSLWVAE